MSINRDELILSIINVYSQIDQGFADDVIQSSISQYLDLLNEFQLEKGQELYKNKNKFLRTHLNKYEIDDFTYQLSTSLSEKIPSISSEGFLAYSVLGTNNAFLEGLSRLTQFNSIQAFTRLRFEILSERYLNLEDVSETEVPTFDEVEEHLTSHCSCDEEIFAARFDDVSISKLNDVAIKYCTVYLVKVLKHPKEYKEFLRESENDMDTDYLDYQEYIIFSQGPDHHESINKKLAHDSFLYQLALDLDTRVLPKIYPAS